MNAKTPSVDTTTDSPYATVELSMNHGAQSSRTWTPNDPISSATKSVTSELTSSASASPFPCRKAGSAARRRC